MINWIKKNWVLIIALLAILIIATSGVAGITEILKYKKQIRALDRDISVLKAGINVSDARADKALAEARTAEEEARAERAEKEKHKANEARLEEEKKGLKERIAALPPTQIVIHTIQIIQVAPEEITLQPQGVLFTLVAARKNLEVLENFSLIERQYSELRISFAKCESSEAKLLLANQKKDKAILEKDGQLADWVEIEKDWNEKFDLSEGRKKKARVRGRKEGAVVTAIFAVVLFVLGK